MKTITALILFVVSCSAVVSYQDNESGVYCGRRLASALALLCDYTLIKKSQTHYGMAQEDFSWPWVEGHTAHSLGRRKRQVVTECCDKPCTINELLSYCGN
ncbi:unnamed protein product [Euphydryas editha]|uniref:Insulin-like domain-containing protein n=1 Tax=Euphydryas editha TaxID=104508 RepID=A0AAU9UA76_EUPED|nr:unnamed protein product [Euphydryas editha]